MRVCPRMQYAAYMIQRKLQGPDAVAPYNPAFSEGVQHFLLHAGGAKVSQSSTQLACVATSAPMSDSCVLVSYSPL